MLFNCDLKREKKSCVRQQQHRAPLSLPAQGAAGGAVPEHGAVLPAGEGAGAQARMLPAPPSAGLGREPTAEGPCGEGSFSVTALWQKQRYLNTTVSSVTVNNN